MTSTSRSKAKEQKDVPAKAVAVDAKVTRSGAGENVVATPEKNTVDVSTGGVKPMECSPSTPSTVATTGSQERIQDEDSKVVYVVLCKNGIAPKVLDNYEDVQRFQTAYPSKVVASKKFDNAADAHAFIKSGTPAKDISESGSPMVALSPYADDDTQKRLRAKMNAKNQLTSFKVKYFQDQWSERVIILIEYFDGQGRKVYCQKEKSWSGALSCHAEVVGVSSNVPSAYAAYVRDFLVRLRHIVLRDSTKGPDAIKQTMAKNGKKYNVYGSVTYLDIGTSVEDRKHERIVAIISAAVDEIKHVMQSSYFQTTYSENITAGLWKQMGQYGSPYWTDVKTAMLVVDKGNSLDEEFVSSDVSFLADLALGVNTALLPDSKANGNP